MLLDILGECCGLYTRSGGLWSALLALGVLQPHLWRLPRGANAFHLLQSFYKALQINFAKFQALWPPLAAS